MLDFFKNKINQILVFIGATVVIFLISYVVYLIRSQSQLIDKINLDNINQKQLIDNLVRSSSSYSTMADVEKAIVAQGLNLKAIQEDMAKLHEELRAVNVSTINTTQQYYVTSGSSTPVTPLPTNITITDGHYSDIYDYYKTVKKVDLSEKYSGVEVPIGSVSFSASAGPGKDFTVNIPARKYSYTTVFGDTENRDRLVNYDKLVITENGKDYSIPISQSSTQEIPLENKWRWFGHLNAMGAVGWNNDFQAMAGLSSSIFSYGKYAKEPTFAFMNIGVGMTTDKTFLVYVNPVSYKLPIFTDFIANTYLTAGLNFNLNTRSIGFHAGFSLNL
jgi:hypothetical protein